MSWQDTVERYPQRDDSQDEGASSGTRTRKPKRSILSRLRIPISPWRRWLKANRTIVRHVVTYVSLTRKSTQVFTWRLMMFRAFS